MKKLKKSFLAFEVVHFTRDQNVSPMAYFSMQGVQTYARI